MLSDIFFAGYGVTVIQGFQGASWPATSSRGRGSWWPGRRATSLRRWPRSKRPTRAASAPCLRSGSRDEIRRGCQSTMAPVARPPSCIFRGAKGADEAAYTQTYIGVRLTDGTATIISLPTKAAAGIWTHVSTDQGHVEGHSTDWATAPRQT